MGTTTRLNDLCEAEARLLEEVTTRHDEHRLEVASAMLTEATSKIAALRAALTEALDAWEGYSDDRHGKPDARPTELRKLTKEP